MRAGAHGGQQRTFGSPGARVKGNWELPDLGTGNQT